VASIRKHLWTVSGLTLVSRVAGLARDAVLAHVLGATQSFVMDAYAMAFRLPNLVRQLLGEGALSAAFVPVFTDVLEKGGKAAASRFMSLMIVLLTATLAAITLAADGLFLVLRYLTASSEKWHLIFGLAAVLFPFCIGVCLVALLQAALNCRRHFTMPALAPIVLNIGIIAGAVAAGILASDDPVVQVYIISAAILVAGVAEVAIQWPALGRVGLVFKPVWDLRDRHLARVVRLIGPMVVAVGVVQFNVFLDSLIANLLSPSTAGPATLSLWGWEAAYPMEMGAAAVLYYGQLIYMFPLGVFGIALATVIFPVLSRFAVRKDMRGLGQAASHALRLALFIGVPSGVGLILVCDPLVRLYLNHGQFAADPAAVPRTVMVAAVYCLGIWAYSAGHILLRAFYAMEDIGTPLRVALVAAGVNFVLNIALVWSMAEAGLAAATVVSAVLRVALLVWLLSKRASHLAWRDIGVSALRTCLATAFMAAAAWAAAYRLAPALALPGRWAYAGQLALGIGAGALVFALAARLMRMGELGDLLTRRSSATYDDSDPPDPAA
jgi:putative peptidoglycan lipid II flippase